MAGEKDKGKKKVQQPPKHKPTFDDLDALELSCRQGRPFSIRERGSTPTPPRPTHSTPTPPRPTHSTPTYSRPTSSTHAAYPTYPQPIAPYSTYYSQPTAPYPTYSQPLAPCPTYPLYQGNQIFQDHGRFMEMMGSLEPYQHQQQPQQSMPRQQPPQQSLPHQSPEQEREEQVRYRTVRRPRRKFDPEVQVLGNKPLIYPMGNGLEPSKEAAEAVRRAIENLYTDFYPTYEAMMAKEGMKREIFEELGKFAVWEPYHHDDVERNFHHVAKNRLSGMLHDAKRAYKKMKAQNETYRAPWIGEEIWKKVLEYWENDPIFKKRSETNKINRNSAKGGNLHTQGCVSVSARARQLIKNKGGEVDMAEIHKDTHTKSSGGYVDQRSEDTQRKYWTFVEKFLQEHPEYHSYDDIPNIIRREIYLEVSGPGKKNKKYGFGKLAPNVHRQNLFHIPTPEECSRPAAFTPAAQAEIERLSQELQAQREEMARRDQEMPARVQEEVRKAMAAYFEQMSASSFRKAPNDDDDDDEGVDSPDDDDGVDSPDDEDPSVSSDSN